MSSLVMLAAPFANLHIFSNVLAQGYDNYYGDSYSKYPTEDFKYKCRAGLFEGFFVSSVELKFLHHSTEIQFPPPHLKGDQPPFG